MAPPHTQLFENATTITPLSSHEYSTNLHPGWAIGAVPHGGYTMSVLYRLAITHFKSTHPTRHNADPMPISMQMTFLRRTAVGPAILTVEDAKLGQRTSTIHVTLSQAETKAINGDKQKRTAKVVGYITVSDPISDIGATTTSAWKLFPPPPSNCPPKLIVTADGGIGDSTKIWKLTAPTRYSKFRKVELQSLTFGPAQDEGSGDGTDGIVDQWTRLRTTDLKQGSSPNSGEMGKWTNEAAVVLCDYLPTGLDGLGKRIVRSSSSLSSVNKSQEPDSSSPPFWYPTVVLNVDFKKRLPLEGVDWLYSRVVMKAVRNGRTDIEVIVMDEEGDIVSLCSQVGLVVGVERNLSGREKTKL